MTTEASRKIRRLISEEEAGRRALLSKSTLRRLRDQGEGPRVVHVSARRIGYFEDEFEAWLEGRANSRGTVLDAG
jgi:predicted DNA-binding transcriptional regulator AlpA